MPAPLALIPAAVIAAGRTAVIRWLSSSAGAAAFKATSQSTKGRVVIRNGKVVKGGKVKSGSPAGGGVSKIKSSGSPAGKPKKIPGQDQIPKKGEGSGLGKGLRPQGSQPLKPDGRTKAGRQMKASRLEREAAQEVARKATRTAAKAAKARAKVIAARKARLKKAAPYGAGGAAIAGGAGTALARRNRGSEGPKSRPTAPAGSARSKSVKGKVWNGSAYVVRKK